MYKIISRVEKELHHPFLVKATSCIKTKARKTVSEDKRERGSKKERSESQPTSEKAS